MTNKLILCSLMVIVAIGCKTEVPPTDAPTKCSQVDSSEKARFTHIETIDKICGEAFISNFETKVVNNADFKPNMNKSITISKGKLLTLINVDTNYDYLKIIIVQPTIMGTQTKYPQIALHSQNDMYLLYTLFNKTTGATYSKKYDIALEEGNQTNTTPVLVEGTDYYTFLNEYESNPSAFPFKGLLEKVKAGNTQRILVNIADLRRIMIAWESAKPPTKSFDRIRLHFGIVDNTHSCLTAEQRNKLEFAHDYFCLLWSPLLSTGDTFVNSYGDINDLCPPNPY